MLHTGKPQGSCSNEGSYNRLQGHGPTLSVFGHPSLASGITMFCGLLTGGVPWKIQVRWLNSLRLSKLLPTLRMSCDHTFLGKGSRVVRDTAWTARREGEAGGRGSRFLLATCTKGTFACSFPGNGLGKVSLRDSLVPQHSVPTVTRSEIKVHFLSGTMTSPSQTEGWFPFNLPIS